MQQGKNDYDGHNSYQMVESEKELSGSFRS